VLLSLPPDVLLIPGTSSVRHLGENFTVSEIGLDQQVRNELAACGLAAKVR
jgi:aryl-alcohol dehydrogenase-like predicted oxidoreductase